MIDARSVLRRSPALFCAVARARQRSRRTVVSRRCDVTVEGYPRSGNSSLVAALRLSFPGLVVASHVHDPAHADRSQRLGVPTLVLLRAPRAAAASTMVFLGDASPAAARAQITRWVDFYRPIATMPGVEVVLFEDVVGDVRALLHWVGRHHLHRDPVLAEDFEDQVRKAVEVMNEAAQGGRASRLGVPTPERKAAALAADEVLATAAASELPQAEALYQELADRRVTLREVDRGQPGQ